MKYREEKENELQLLNAYEEEEALTASLTPLLCCRRRALGRISTQHDH